MAATFDCNCVFMHGRKYYFVYILASRRNGTLYTGVTNNLVRRVYEHKSDLVERFTRRYGVHRHVWFETSEDINAAISLEKRIKQWRRAWKIELIEKSNPEWDDLYDRL
jgi:putative endonuclease